MFKVHTISRNKTRGCWSVLLHHEESGKGYWLDACLNEEYHDVEVEWNQYIFYLADPDDLERKMFQEDCNNFDEASSEVVCILESENEIFHGEDGDWYIKDEEWKGEAVWKLMK